MYSDGKGLGAEDVQLERVFSGMNDWSGQLWVHGGGGHWGCVFFGDMDELRMKHDEPSTSQ